MATNYARFLELFSFKLLPNHHTHIKKVYILLLHYSTKTLRVGLHQYSKKEIRQLTRKIVFPLSIQPLPLLIILLNGISGQHAFYRHIYLLILKTILYPIICITFIRFNKKNDIITPVLNTTRRKLNYEK